MLTNDEDLAERVDFYTHLGHLRGHVHGVNYKLAAPLAAIGLRRLAGLQAQLDARCHTAQRILNALPPDGLLAELGHDNDDWPNCYNLVLTASREGRHVAQALADIGLSPDSTRYGYRPLYQRPIFADYATGCPNAETLATNTLQIPVHPASPRRP